MRQGLLSSLRRTSNGEKAVILWTVLAAILLLASWWRYRETHTKLSSCGNGSRARRPALVIGIILCTPSFWIPRPAWAVYVPGTPASEIVRRAYAGNPDAEYTVGYWHYCGFDGFTRSLADAREWYRKAASGGSARAQAALGELYEFGEGVRQDHNRALMWVHKSMITGDNGNPSGALIIALRYDTGERPMVSEECHSQTPYRDPAKAIEWYEIAAEAGDDRAKTNMAKLYESDPAVQNMQEAIRWYRAAAEHWPPAAVELARLYVAGKGVPQDYVEAAQWYAKAVKSDREAQYELGLLYEQGLGVTEDRDKAMELYHEAAVQNADAQRRLFKLYEAGLALSTESGEAVSWYEASAEQGNRRALVGLGLHYEFGVGVPKNAIVACALFAMGQQAPGPSNAPDFAKSLCPSPHAFGDDRVQALLRRMAKPGNLRAAIDSGVVTPVCTQPARLEGNIDATALDLTVRLKGFTADPKAVAAELSKKYGFEILWVLPLNYGGGFRASLLTPSEIAQLRCEPDIEVVRYDDEPTDSD
jgi:TPR repeat protein